MVSTFVALKNFSIDTSQEDTLEHDNVSHDLTSQKSVLEFLIGYEIVKPILSKLGDASH